MVELTHSTLKLKTINFEALERETSTEKPKTLNSFFC